MSEALFIAGSISAGRVSGLLNIKVKSRWILGDALTAPAVTPSQQAFQVESAMEKPENKGLRVPAFNDKDIGRLDVAVHNASAVGGIERIGDLDPKKDVNP